MVAAAAVGAGTSPSEAENVTARVGEIVAREAPGSGQAGIAVIRGTDRVQLLGERDGWSEILLPDKRRAWVPTAEITRAPEAPRPTEGPATATATVPATDTEASVRDLAIEVARLRQVVDDLATWRTNLPDGNPSTAPLPDTAPWAIGGAALVVGLLIGGALERRRGRRERALRF